MATTEQLQNLNQLSVARRGKCRSCGRRRLITICMFEACQPGNDNLCWMCLPEHYLMHELAADIPAQAFSSSIQRVGPYEQIEQDKIWAAAWHKHRGKPLDKRLFGEQTECAGRGQA